MRILSPVRLMDGDARWEGEAGQGRGEERFDYLQLQLQKDTAIAMGKRNDRPNHNWPVRVEKAILGHFTQDRLEMGLASSQSPGLRNQRWRAESL